MKMNYRRELWLIALLTLIAFALRLADLTARSLWLDEAFTLARIFGTWPDLLRNVVPYDGIVTVDTQPQAYFALLKTWLTLAGESEFALKVTSAFAGVVSVPLMYALTRRTLTRGAAILAAVFALLSPVVQWYSHELRMYSLVVCLSALSIYLLRCALFSHDSSTRERILRWLAWLLASVVALLTHYSFAGLFAAQVGFAAVISVMRWRRRGPRSKRDGLALVLAGLVVVSAIAVVSLLVGLPSLVRRLFTGPEYSFSFVPLHTMFQSLFSGALFGVNAIDPTGSLFTWFVAGLCVFGAALWWIRRRGKRVDIALLATCALVPVLTWFALSFIKPNYHGIRHLIVVMPPLTALLAGTIDLLLRGAPSFQSQASAPRAPDWTVPVLRGFGVVALIGVLMAQTYGTAYAFVRTPDWQDDWRALAQYIRDHWQPQDAMWENAGAPERIVPLYLRGLPVESTRLSTVLALGLPPEDVTRATANRSQRVWFVNTGGKAIGEGEGAQWLSPFFVRERVHFPGRTNTLELALLETRSPISNAMPLTAAQLSLPEEHASPIRLAGYEIRPGAPYNARPNVQLTLYWQRVNSDALPEKVEVNARLTHDGVTWLDWIFPAKLDAASNAWTPGSIFRVDHVIPLPLGLPNQPYQLELNVRAGAKGESIQNASQPVTPEQIACCIRVTHWLESNTADVWQASDAALMQAEFLAAVRPGEALPVALTWRKTRDDPFDKLRAGAAEWQTRLSLDGLLGGSLAFEQSPAGTDASPVSTWPRDEPVRDVHTLQLPQNARPGWYRLSLDRYRGDQRIDGTLLGLVEVRDYPSTPVPADIQHPVDARIGEIDLLGYGVDVPFERGKTYDVHTYWRVEAAPTRDGVLFLHVIGPDGKPVSQDDNPPERGKRSTLTYRSGNGIDQIHRIEIPPHAPAGEYRLYAGIYDREGRLRWPAQQDGQPAKDDLVRVGSFTLP